MQVSENLLNLAFDLTVHGIILTSLIILAEGRITGSGVVVICCFLAASFFWKMMWPAKLLQRYFVWRMFSVGMVMVFSWWLIYTAENTRAGWYRFNVLQGRVKTFVRHAPSYVVLADCNGVITETSDNIELLTGYTRGELVGKYTTVLMRDAPAVKHHVAYEDAVKVLRDNNVSNTGWTLQGVITVGVKHKNGHVVPVRIYAGGIRWSTEIQFTGDIDIFAVFVPVSKETAESQIKEGGDTTLAPGTKIKEAPAPPQVLPLAPLPPSVSLPPPENEPISKP